MEDGKNTDQDPAVLEFPAVTWSKYVANDSVQYIQMGQTLSVNAEEATDWDLRNRQRGDRKRK